MLHYKIMFNIFLAKPEFTPYRKYSIYFLLTFAKLDFQLKSVVLKVISEIVSSTQRVNINQNVYTVYKIPKTRTFFKSFQEVTLNNFC